MVRLVGLSPEGAKIMRLSLNKSAFGWIRNNIQRPKSWIFYICKKTRWKETMFIPDERITTKRHKLPLGYNLQYLHKGF